MSMLHGRRHLLKSMLGFGAKPLLAQVASRRAGQDQASGLKSAHRLNATSVTDNDLLFLQQIGLAWGRLEIPEAALSAAGLLAAQQRFARFGMGIFSIVQPSQ